ncbi:MAG: hypothetical protein RLZZ324_1144, partial [Candidatus Parcubacteria bacterium]
ASGRVVKSTVTDAEGRFSFLAAAGAYRIEAVKHGMTFPSAVTADLREAGAFTELYHGEVIQVGAAGAVLTPSIPMDPAHVDAPDAVVARRQRSKNARRFVAGLGPTLGVIAFVVKPGAFTALLFVAQLVTYALFRRLAAPRTSKNWGIVYEEGSKRPVPFAIARVFEAKYNKLLESQVTDDRGRYQFRVGGNVYYLTVSKDGFHKTQTDPVDLSAVTEPTVIASDLPLRPAAPSSKPA